jgi:flagellar FliJ protein
MRPFRLHTVLNYRQRLQDKAQERLVRAKEEEDRIRMEMEREQERLREMCRRFETRKKEGISVREVLVYQNHIGHIRNRLAQLDGELQSAQQEVARKERELRRASREKKLLEKLKEKQDHRYVQFLEDREKKELDEVAVLFHKR